MEEMEVLIAGINAGNPDLLAQYEIQQKNLDILIYRFSVEAIAADLKEQVSGYLNI